MKLLAMLRLIMVIKEALEDGKIDEKEAVQIVKTLTGLIK